MFVEIREDKDNFRGWTYRLSIKQKERDHNNLLVCYVSYTIRFNFESFEFQNIDREDLEKSSEDLMNLQKQVKIAHQLAVRFCKVLVDNESSLKEDIQSKGNTDRKGDIGIYFDELQAILAKYDRLP